MNFQWQKLFRKYKDVVTYSIIAQFYDEIMDHVDYPAWVDYLEKLINKFGKHVHKVVDAGCGTGIIAFLLKQRGYFVTGFDSSIQMLQMAKLKYNLPVWQGDLRSFALSIQLDAVFCLYDTINYLTLEEMEHLFFNIKYILRKGGLCIFDTITEAHILNNWVNFTECNIIKNWEFVRRSWYNRNNNSQHTEFVMFNTNERKYYREHHIQWIYRLAQLEYAAIKNGFKMLGRYQEYSFKTGSEKSDRVHFILMRE
jgi:SAM-dependent methyltransferase